MAEEQRGDARSTGEAAERERVEEALRDSGARYRILADTTPLPVIVADLDGIVLYANERAAALFEVPWEQGVGQYMPDFYIDPQARVAYLEQLREHGRVIDHEMCLETASGRKFWALVSASVTMLEGRPAIYAVFNDITERRALEEELRRRAEQLEQANLEAQEARRIAEKSRHAQSVFLANMSHELRTPLNAILGFSEILAQDPTLTPAQRENARTIHRSGERLLLVLNDVLDMARLDAGRVDVELQEMDLLHLLNGLIETFRFQATDKGLSFVAELAPDLPRGIVSDEHKLRQILFNLLSNAVKFTDSGEVALRVWVEKHQQPGPPGWTLVCVVQDTGPGIAPERQESVFQPFAQITADGRSREGTGLGLPISRQYARMLGGDLTLSSAGVPGAGTRMELRIPISPAEGQGSVEPDRPAGQSAQSDWRLLVVEQQPESRLLLEAPLRQMGFAVRSAWDGQEALRLWKEWRPHLIWLNPFLAGMDGYEVTRRIKATPQGRSTVVVAVMAGTDPEERRRGQEAGCDDFLTKPFRPSDLEEILARHLGAPVPDRERPAEAAVALSTQPGKIDLAGVPPAWLAGVRQAAVAADGSRLLSLAEEIRAERPALAAALRALAEEFDYDAILTIAQEESDG